MFNLFKKDSPGGATVVDKVWLTKQAKWRACVQMAKASQELLLVTWFDATFKEAENFPDLKGRVVMARDLNYDKSVGKMIVFAEHYPLPAIEEALFITLKLKEVPVLSCMEEPIFMQFGGENTIDLIRKLGMAEDEIIAHSMVTKSIRRAQEKIASKTRNEYPAQSAEEWFTLNYK